ncbi:hypothetical protein BC628DRAFT_1324108 [Trametes gibbosa]|nr:hypothetical protein BC628DRAFT_1324108 [Trametes gibbosa]
MAPSMLALAIAHDSGIPPSSTDYTTLILIHGLGYHAGVFKNLLPFAEQFNTRFILVNRRDYPGALPYSSDELRNFARLVNSPSSAEARAEATKILAEHARDVRDFLEDFICRERIPLPTENGGGIVLAGWSLGAVSVTALLADANSSRDGAQLSKYIRRFVLYEPSSALIGYPSPVGHYHPLRDPSIAVEQRFSLFDEWVSSYFDHGDVWTQGSAALAYRHPATNISSTKSRMSAADLAMAVYGPTAEPTGGDSLFIFACILHDVLPKHREDVFFLRGEGALGADEWRGAEVRLVWGDRSIWEVLWAAYLLNKELQESRDAGKPVRSVDFVQLKGANHFAHWDMPEKTLRALLGHESVIQ